ncbi:DUF1634 domain-containing protein [Pelobacter propionicus]|uniref:DUF1634 domain-containing protein n=1 Tax=Pelobacter propionicus (strain DSM 2379 / NBRC 103807 / OttBd1) TaxID=338966 RepID=A1AN99_PELPD|nr:DUF1634 domain-containing protein [Pelobacter propionicus]ABK98819.1 protein of unknown function DUF1634 [Pelobacter propionicus DSM 2379]
MMAAGRNEKTTGEPIEIVLARLLRIGTVIAAALLATGIGAMLLAGANWAPRLITAGLVVLLGTPVMRVLVAGLVFVRQRDWLFSLFCLIVLCSLAAGIILGRV